MSIRVVAYRAVQLDARAFRAYSDFGDTTVGKLTGRYDFTPQFAFARHISNGF